MDIKRFQYFNLFIFSKKLKINKFMKLKFGMGDNFSKLYNIYNDMNSKIPIKKVFIF